MLSGSRQCDGILFITFYFLQQTALHYFQQTEFGILAHKQCIMRCFALQRWRETHFVFRFCGFFSSQCRVSLRIRSFDRSSVSQFRVFNLIYYSFIAWKHNMYLLTARVVDQARVLMQLHLYNHGSDEGGCVLHLVHIWHFRRSVVFHTNRCHFLLIAKFLIGQWMHAVRNSLIYELYIVVNMNEIIMLKPFLLFSFFGFVRRRSTYVVKRNKIDLISACESQGNSCQINSPRLQFVSDRARIVHRFVFRSKLVSLRLIAQVRRTLMHCKL